MAFHIYNTLTRKKELFEPVEPNKVKMYLCGPTVYDFFHIGNARPLIMFDVLRRYLRYRGFDVRYVVNITDIDDKIINKAIAQNRTASEVATEFTRAYFQDIDKLGIERPDLSPRATDFMRDIINTIQQLIDRGFAYELDGDVYYEVEKFVGYGKLSGKNINELQAGARVDVDDRKRSPMDFAVWKSSKPGEPWWESPWGKGRPGWHIECSVMSSKLLGGTFDIHAGGVDLIFPHHENEIAQAEGASDCPFVHYWMHNGFLNIEGEKMSKSLGNFFTTREILAKYPAEVLRMFFLLKHYRSPINFSEERILESQQALERIVETLKNIDLILADFQDVGAATDETIANQKAALIDAMDDDFNTASAMGTLFELVKSANLIIAENNFTKENIVTLKAIRELLVDVNEFFGIIPDKSSGTFGTDESFYLDMLTEIRRELRDARQWGMADTIRDRLQSIGIELEDRKDKSIWKRNFNKK
ncbi:cysteine--tRNA ligase [candidate division KSB1 bacterium]|nr:cysteine--tRNA ligase [candidate division KSB1 bacterium]